MPSRVESAYAQLAAEGYIVSREKSGYFVSQLEPALPSPVPAPHPTVLRPGAALMMELREAAGAQSSFPSLSGPS